jgi:hypothetical protein
MSTCPLAVAVSEPDEHGVESELERALRVSQEIWDEAVAGHRLAPPDAGFSDRLDRLAVAAGNQAQLSRLAHYEGFKWMPHTGMSEPPWELHPESGRRGPVELWRRFDEAVASFARAGRGSNLLEVANALGRIGGAAADLSEAIARADRASGLLAPSEEDTPEYWTKVVDPWGVASSEAPAPPEN